MLKKLTFCYEGGTAREKIIPVYIKSGAACCVEKWSKVSGLESNGSAVL